MKKIKEDFGLSEKQVRAVLLERKKEKPKILRRYFTNKEIKFGIVSDTHLCSNYERLNELHTFYAICEKVGVSEIIHAGDIIDGNGKMYRGQLNEIHTYGVMRQVKYAVKNYPKIEGINTYFICGNHCLSFYNDNGIDIGKLIEEKREDMHYLGQYRATIQIGKAIMEVVHPAGGIAYALSYKSQKYAEQIPSGQKPNVLIFGHWHTSHYFWYRNIHILNAGCFQGQTSYLARKGLNPAIGGWICTIKEGKQKRDKIVAFEPCWIPFF
jgi:predicted phosphodiesterase